MPEHEEARLFFRLIRLLLWAALGWLVLTVAVPWLMPFLLALAIAALLEPVVTLLMRIGLPRWGAAALCTTALTALLCAALVLGLWRLGVEAADLLERLPSLLARLDPTANRLEDWAYRFMVAVPPQLRAGLQQALDSLAQQGSALPARLYDRVGQWLAWTASALPGAILFLFTTALATYFTSAGRPALLAFLRRQAPRRWQDRLEEIRVQLKGTLGGWLRAQGLLMLATFGEVLLGLLVLGIPQALLLSALTALVDALPVFGAGTVLLPWAAGCLLGGRWGEAVGLLALYGLVSLVRSFLEPKLLGDRMGLPPLAALCAMYVGFRAFGVAGMILSPLALTFLKQLQHCGLIRLWRV